MLKSPKLAIAALFLCFACNVGATVGKAEKKDALYFAYEVDGREVEHRYVFGTKLYQQPDIPSTITTMPMVHAFFSMDRIEAARFSTMPRASS